VTRPGWLVFLGRRRPVDLGDHAEYQEITHDKATPQAGGLPAHVEGHSISAGHRRGGRHRAQR
jgi:hypothetical protein